MSFKHFAEVWGYSRATGNDLLVHLAMADLANESLVSATQADIANVARCSVATVSRSLASLLDAGMIVRETSGRTPIYRLAAVGNLEPRPNLYEAPAGDVAVHSDDYHQNEVYSPDMGRHIASNQGAAMGSDIGSMLDMVLDADSLASGLRGLLSVMQVPVPEGAPPLYWLRHEHLDDYLKLLKFAGMTPGELMEQAKAAGATAATAKTVDDLYMPLARYRIITPQA